MSHPYAEATAHAALANLVEACEAIENAKRARTVGGTMTLLARASFLAINAREKLRDALTLEEMACTTGEESGERLEEMVAGARAEREAAE